MRESTRIVLQPCHVQRGYVVATRSERHRVVTPAEFCKLLGITPGELRAGWGALVRPGATLGIRGSVPCFLNLPLSGSLDAILKKNPQATTDLHSLFQVVEVRSPASVTEQGPRP